MSNPPWNVSSTRRFDFTLRHVFSADQWWRDRAADAGCDRGDGRWFDQVVAGYERVFSRARPPILVPVREPTAHLLSVLHYYGTPIAEFVKTPRLWNPLAKDLRLINTSHVRRFLDAWLSVSTTAKDQPGGQPMSPRPSDQIFPLLADDLFASLVTLRRKLGWNLSDVVHARITHARDLHAGPPRGSTQEQSDAAASLRNTVPAESLALDWELYKGFSQLAAQRRRGENSDDFETEVTALRRISEALPLVCAHAREGGCVSWQEEAANAIKPGEWKLLTTSSSTLSGLQMWCAYACASELQVESWACSDQHQAGT